MILRTLLTASLVLFGQNAVAHDFWIEPSTFRPARRQSFTVALRVGENFEGDPVPRRSPRIESFVVRDRSGERAVNGVENQDPAGFVRIDEAGPVVVGYRGKPTPHELPTPKFVQFLREEGIDGIEPRGPRQRERFYRFAKSIVQVGDARTEDRPFNWRFELVRLDDSRFQLLFEQKPLKAATVFAISADGRKLRARTDKNGTVSFDLGDGVWLIKSTHLIPAAPDSGFDYESLWASLTFQR